LEGFDEPQLLPSLPLQTDEHRWAKQKGGCFLRVLPIDATQLAEQVAESPKRPAVELAAELTSRYQLSAGELKEVWNYIQHVSIGMQQFCWQYADFQPSMPTAELGGALAKLQEGRQTVSHTNFIQVELD